MIPQLDRLTRPIGRSGATALAVYASGGRHRPARDAGFEGVACVDDAARAIRLYLRLGAVTGDPEWLSRANGLGLGLLLLQQPDGNMANFMLDWRGTPNLTGDTSAPGNSPWGHRALLAFAELDAATGDDRYGAAFEALLPHLETPTRWLQCRALGILALAVWRATPVQPRLRCLLQTWSGEVMGEVRGDGALRDAAGSDVLHLWGHVQEAALVAAGLTLADGRLVRAAMVSADAWLIPAAATRFAEAGIAYDVSSAVTVFDSLARATGHGHYVLAAEAGRRWFEGHNAAGLALYDETLGLVADGIDTGRLNQNSGAESNIEAGLALSTDPVRAQRIGDRSVIAIRVA